MAVTPTIVCGCWMVNTVERGVTLTPSIWVFILREGFHKHSHAASRPWGLWFVNELLYWLASLLASLEDTNNTTTPTSSYSYSFPPQKSPRRLFILLLILCTGRKKMWVKVGGVGWGWGGCITESYCMFDLNLQACHLFPPSSTATTSVAPIL